MFDLKEVLKGVLSMIDDFDKEHPKPDEETLNELITDIYGYVEKALKEN